MRIHTRLFRICMYWCDVYAPVFHICQLCVCSVIWFTGNTPQAQTHGQFPLTVGSLAWGLILSYDSEDGPGSGATLNVRVKTRRRGIPAGPSVPLLKAQKRRGARSPGRAHAKRMQKNGNVTASTVRIQSESDLPLKDAWAERSVNLNTVAVNLSHMFARLKIKE